MAASSILAVGFSRLKNMAEQVSEDKSENKAKTLKKIIHRSKSLGKDIFESMCL
jgi:hypothetical protein